MIRSEAFIKSYPDGTRVSMLSVSALGTLIVSLQGIQAVYAYLIISSMDTGSAPIIYSTLPSLGNTFAALGLGSLFRLLPALWLSNEFGYQTDDSGENCLNTEDRPIPPPHSETGTLCLHPQGYWPALILQLFFLGVILTIFILLLTHFANLQAESPVNNSFDFDFPTMSEITYLVLYLALSVQIFSLSIFYIARGVGRSTLIPCCNSHWYSFLTLFWYLLAIAAVVIRAIESRRTACGFYTTAPDLNRYDKWLC